jgi:flagellar hook-associated protein 1 FlgK
MADIGKVLYTAQEALLSNLTAINATGSNIANVNTPGYSRVRPLFESVGSKDPQSGREQIGVRISNIERIYDKFLETQMIAQQSALSKFTTREDILSRVEAIFNENTGGGINDAIGDFFNAWGNLSVDPLSKAKRDMVISTGENLSRLFNLRVESLENLQLNADESIANEIATLNSYLKDVARYNELIVSAENAGSTAHAVRDHRGLILNEISQIININYVEKPDGSIYIYMPDGGKTLVEGFNSWELMAQVNPANHSFYDVVFKNDPTQILNDRIGGGRLGAYLEMRDKDIPSYIEKLDDTALAIMDRVNTLHADGFDQDGTGGVEFFSSNPANPAATMSVNITDTRRIAASVSEHADGNNATAITGLKTEINTVLGTTIDGYFNSFIAKIGRDAVDAKQAVIRETTIYNQQVEQREQLSGVSLDEEMMNLIKYQMAYGAAGKMTATVNELIDTLLNLIR